MLSKETFIGVVRGELALPLADERLEEHFDQQVRGVRYSECGCWCGWRS